MMEYSADDFNKHIENFLKDRLFIDEVHTKGLVLPKGTWITTGYEVILPEGITKADLLCQLKEEE